MADNPLYQDPGNYASMGDMLAKVMNSAFMKSENMLPAKVVSYDREKNVAVIQPLVKIVLTGETVSRPEIGPIPVFAFGAGNFVINFPIKVGDIGWILANDRDTTSFLDSLEEAEPKTYRLHSFNDAVFFPDVIRNFTTSGEDGNMVIQSLDGKIRISLGQSQVKISHPTKILLDAPLVEVKQDLKGPGTSTFDTDHVSAGISGKNHVHGGVQAGSAKTQKPE